MPINDASARLDLPYVAAGQLQKHVTINQALTRLDALVQAAVISRTVAEQPDDVSDGALYILPDTFTGVDWIGFAPGDLVRADTGGWVRIPAPDGLLVLVLDTGELLARRDGAWRGPGAIQGLDRLGLRTSADAENPFAARLNKALWTALETGSGGTGDLRFTLNKQGSANLLSLLFQSGYGGRAQIGLLGHDDLTIMVSPDGTTWHLAMAVDRSDGRARFPLGAARCETQVLDQSGAYAIPTWARRLDVIAVGGGGGGGAGSSGASGAARFGGGGGGAGGMTEACWNTADLPATLHITVGSGGTGGAGSSATIGQSGSTGAVTTVSASGSIVLTALGGFGGQGGSSGGGLGGSGGRGLVFSNGGGDSSVTVSGRAGRSEDRPDGSGGGGGGGGLDAAGTSRGGGAGGTGAILGQATSGGTAGQGGPGGSGQSATDSSRSWAGGGGGGGGAKADGAAHAGGTGASGGAGGGGGGAGSTVSGSGGTGGPGLVRITAFG